MSLMQKTLKRFRPIRNEAHEGRPSLDRTELFGTYAKGGVHREERARISAIETARADFGIIGQLHNNKSITDEEYDAIAREVAAMEAELLL